MTAVLLDSVRVGASGWIATRRAVSLKVSGMLKGDRLSVGFLPSREELSVEEDGCFPLPEGAIHVQVKHLEAASRGNGDGGVCVDLMRKN